MKIWGDIPSLSPCIKPCTLLIMMNILEHIFPNINKHILYSGKFPWGASIHTFCNHGYRYKYYNYKILARQGLKCKIATKQGGIAKIKEGVNKNLHLWKFPTTQHSLSGKQMTSARNQLEFEYWLSPVLNRLINWLIIRSN